MQTVVEMPSYLRAVESIFTQAEREAIVAMVASEPECGEVMQGTGGLRKVRVGRVVERGLFASCAMRDSPCFS
jgi:hypothetical protein